MGRKKKPLATSSHHYTKAELNAIGEEEKKLKGNKDKLKPPKELNKTQKKIFKEMVKELDAVDILDNKDVAILEQYSVALEKTRYMEKRMNEEEELLLDKIFMSTYNKFHLQLTKCINELGLSPTSRSKIANANAMAKANKKDPLLKALNGGSDGYDD